MFANQAQRTNCPDRGRVRRGSRLTAAAASLFTVGTLFTAGAAVASPDAAPQAPAGISAEAGKPGLISSDFLKVVKETGEWDGDEPVMLTVRLESVLGQPGATRVSLVNAAPGEIASGVDAGDTVRIQDAYGDAWFGTAPLTADAIMDAVANQTPLPIPVVVNATVMLEGDLSNGARIGAMGQTVADHLQRSLAKELADTKVIVGEDGKVAGLADAMGRIQAAATPKADVIGQLVVQKIVDWAASAGDPDDPVGLSLTALVPVDSSVTDLLGGPGALGLDSQYMKVTKHELRTKPFDADIEVRTGLLVPPSALGGKPQEWWTTYAGDYMLDDPVEYRVFNQAWPQISW